MECRWGLIHPLYSLLNSYCFIRQNPKSWHTYGAISQLGRGGGYLNPHNSHTNYDRRLLFKKAKSKIVTYIRDNITIREGRGYLIPHNSRTNYIGRLNFLWHLHLIIYDLPWKTKRFILNIFCFIRQNSKSWHTYGAISQLGRGGGYITYPEIFTLLSLIFFVL